MLNPVPDLAALRRHRAPLLGRLLRHACRLDVVAPKPGNVSLQGSAHGMTADDFLRSADAIVEPMTRPEASIGARIFDSIAATRTAVGCNTNLGIVLLCAPLTHAALNARPGQGLRAALAGCLDQLTVADAEATYAAIRLAQPAGLGRRAEHDVAEPATITLREAMAQVQDVDSIARQYANGFDELFVRQPIIAQLLRRWNDEPWAAVAVYLDMLAQIPDSHIARKSGLEAALRISHEALPLSQSVLQSADPREFEDALAEWDASLKSRGVNPGTTADLTVAAFYMHGILAMPEFELTASGAFAPPMANQPWEQSRILAN